LTAVAASPPQANVTNEMTTIAFRAGVGAGAAVTGAAGRTLRRSMIRSVGVSQTRPGIASSPATCMRNDSRPMKTMLACPVSDDSLTVLPPFPHSP
jgi:hypothetical protein